MTIIGSLRGGEAFVPITLKRSARSLEGDAVIDTGFNGFLALPPDLMSEFGHGFVEFTESVLADGSVIEHRLMVIHVHLGIKATPVRTVRAIELGREPLIGMAFLHGHRLTIDIVEGGRVLIEPLSPLT